jgi:CRP-like cAMP-binding protein
MNSLLDHIKQYHNLSQDALNSMIAVFEKVELAKGSYLITEGKICQHIYFLEKGSLRGFYNLDGKEITYWFGFENTFVTSFYSFITHKPSNENIHLLEDCTLWGIAYDRLQRLYNQHADIERLGRKIVEQYYVMLEDRFLANHFKESRERYDNLMTNAPHILQRIPLGYVASYLGISQETLSRIRSKG